MLRVRTAVLVSGGGTNLQALIDAEKRGGLPGVELCLVVSNNAGAYALTRAAEAGIESVFIENDCDFEERLKEELAERGVEMIRRLVCERIPARWG